MNTLFKILILIPLLSISFITFSELNKLTDLSKIDPLKELSEALAEVKALNRESNRTTEVKNEEKIDLTNKDYLFLSVIDSIEEKLLSIEEVLLKKYESQLRKILNSHLNHVNQPDEETVLSVVETLKEKQKKKENHMEDYKIINDYEDLIGKAKGFNHELYEYSEKANLYYNKLLNLDKILLRQAKENERILPFLDEVLYKNGELKKGLLKELSQVENESESNVSDTYKSLVSMLNATELNEKLIGRSSFLDKSIDLFVNDMKDKEKK